MSGETIAVRSYRRVFRLERRIYRIDRFPVPVPGGIPLRALVAFLLALIALVLAARMPGLATLVGLLSPPLRYAVVPLALAVLATQVAPDGRSAPRFLLSWLTFRLRAPRRAAGRAVPREGEARQLDIVLALRRDWHCPELRRARVHGPVRVRFREPVALRKRRGGRLQALPVAGKRWLGTAQAVSALDLRAGERLELRP